MNLLKHAARRLQAWLIFDVGQFYPPSMFNATTPHRDCIGRRLSLVLILCAAQLWSAEPPPPQLSGFISSPTSGTMFAVRWQSPDGGSFQSWLRLGESAGSFKLVDYDPKLEVLSVEDRLGHLHRLTLPQGRVREQKLTDREFSELHEYVLPGADAKNAPVLSRDKAREFYMRLISQPDLVGVEIVFDVDGVTLPPQMQARWMEDRIKARASGRLLIAVIVDGRTGLHNFPLKPHPVPEQMTRNLVDADWDEIALLDATNSLKRRILRKK